MGSVGKSESQSVPEKFVYQRSSDLKEISPAEEKRSADMSKFVLDRVYNLKDDYGDPYYEENFVEDIYKETFPADANFKENEFTISKMNLTYTGYRDEEDRRVKQGKALTGSTYYVVQDDDGAIDENHFAYKTKADAEHALKLHLDWYRQWRDYYNRKRG